MVEGVGVVEGVGEVGGVEGSGTAEGFAQNIDFLGNLHVQEEVVQQCIEPEGEWVQPLQDWKAGR